MIGGCAAKEPPAPPPLRLAVKAPKPKPESPPPSTSAEILAVQPPQVREAIREHEESGKWTVYRTTDDVLYPYDKGRSRSSTVRRCAQLISNSNRARPSPT
jgi:hypothetical protein